MGKKSIWKSKFERAQAETAQLVQAKTVVEVELDIARNTVERQAQAIAGLCDAMLATAEQLEVRKILDTARHIRKIADNYSPAPSAVNGCDKQ